MKVESKNSKIIYSYKVTKDSYGRLTENNPSPTVSLDRDDVMNRVGTIGPP